MACINPDGTLTPTAQAVINALQAPCTHSELAQAVGLPVYRVRSTIRELIEAGLVQEIEGKYHLTKPG
jgi:predicted transcriptional regulator